MCNRRLFFGDLSCSAPIKANDEKATNLDLEHQPVWLSRLFELGQLRMNKSIAAKIGDDFKAWQLSEL